MIFTAFINPTVFTIVHLLQSSLRQQGQKQGYLLHLTDSLILILGAYAGQCLHFIWGLLLPLEKHRWQDACELPGLDSCLTTWIWEMSPEELNNRIWVLDFYVVKWVFIWSFQISSNGRLDYRELSVSSVLERIRLKKRHVYRKFANLVVHRLLSDVWDGNTIFCCKLSQAQDHSRIPELAGWPVTLLKY